MLRKAAARARGRGARPSGRPRLELRARPSASSSSKLLAFPAEVAEAAERRAPHRIATYALELAQAFTAFYRDCRVEGAEPEALESFRIALSVAAKRTHRPLAGPARGQRPRVDVARPFA